MKLIDLFEKTRINIDVLGALADELLSDVRYSIDYGQRVELRLNRNFVETIRQKYGDAEAEYAYYLARWVPIQIVNIGPAALNGSYSHSPSPNEQRYDRITVFVPQDPQNPQQMVSPRQIQQNRTIKSTLMHELRHVAQRTKFGQYYHKVATDMTNMSDDSYTSQMAKYKVDPMEIDASFMHIINDHSDIPDPEEFARAVVGKLSTYKKLTLQQQHHYFKKAVAYAMDRNGPEVQKPALQDRLKKKKRDRQEQLTKLLDPAIKDLEYLRNIGMSPHGHNTSFPAAAVIKGHLKSMLGLWDLERPDIFLMGASVIYKWVQHNNIQITPSELIGKAAPIRDEWWDQTEDLINSHQLFQKMDKGLMIKWVRELKNDLVDAE